MSNKIMLSIHHIHTERIFSGQKTLEIRKSAPSITPFIVYMYETKSGGGAGAVVGQFKCKEVKKTDVFSSWSEELQLGKTRECIIKASCLSFSELVEYANGGDICALIVSDVIRYPVLLPLSAFGINRAPQSWQYIK